MDRQSSHEEHPENTGNAFTGFANVDAWLKCVERCSRALCRIEIPGGTAQGTGFLVQPNMIITNYHVMQPIIDDPSLCKSIVIRFGFQTTSGNRALSAGTECELATDANWIAASSPTEELDFVLVRIRAASKNTENMAKIALYRLTPEEYYTFIPAEPLCILQHPLGNAQKIKWGSVVRVKGDDTRVYYTTETLQGSSGAPCFNSDMKLVALHQGNQKNTNEKRGIPFSTIMAYLHQHYQGLFNATITKHDTTLLVNVLEQWNHALAAFQTINDIFYSAGDLSGDRRFISYQYLKEAIEVTQKIEEELQSVQVVDTTLHYRLANEQTYFSVEAGNLMMSLQDFSRQSTPQWLRRDVQGKLVPILSSLHMIEHLIILFGSSLV